MIVYHFHCNLLEVFWGGFGISFRVISGFVSCDRIRSISIVSPSPRSLPVMPLFPNISYAFLALLVQALSLIFPKFLGFPSEIFFLDYSLFCNLRSFNCQQCLVVLLYTWLLIFFRRPSWPVNMLFEFKCSDKFSWKKIRYIIGII